MDKEALESLYAFFSWLLYSGGAALFVSWLLDKIPAFQALKSEVKKIVALVSTLTVGLGAYAFITYVPPDVILVLDPWFKIIVGLVLTWSGQQVYHKLTK